MKVWHCTYHWCGSYGAYQNYDCIVIAEIESKAIGMALMHYDDSRASCWTASEIIVTKEGVWPISSECD